MPVPLEEYVRRLEESGVLSQDSIKAFLPPISAPKGTEDLVIELVKNKKLTKYQAAEVYQGKGKSLVLGKYVLMEKIGAGGMGQVFKARHQRMDRLVALKVLSEKTAKDSDAISRFEREVKAAAKISHPNIVAAHDADCDNGIHFLVMELVEGSDLSAMVKKNGPLPVDKAIDYFIQAASGLEAAHKKGIVHRDIKPSNILVTTEGTAKILDMGLALLKEETLDPSQEGLTTEGKIMGTVDFMSPEQAIDTHAADARTDVYALGCSFYYVLIGKPLYPGKSPLEKLMAHRVRPIPSIRANRPDVSEQLDQVYMKSVAKRVTDRYQTMTEFLEALRSCVTSESPAMAGASTSAASPDSDFLKMDLSELFKDEHRDSDSSEIESPSHTKKHTSNTVAQKLESTSENGRTKPSKKKQATATQSTKSKKEKPSNQGGRRTVLMIAGSVVTVAIVAAGIFLSMRGSRTADKPASVDQPQVVPGNMTKRIQVRD